MRHLESTASLHPSSNRKRTCTGSANKACSSLVTRSHLKRKIRIITKLRHFRINITLIANHRPFRQAQPQRVALVNDVSLLHDDGWRFFTASRNAVVAQAGGCQTAYFVKNAPPNGVLREKSLSSCIIKKMANPFADMDVSVSSGQQNAAGMSDISLSDFSGEKYNDILKVDTDCSLNISPCVNPTILGLNS
jgi:hypothetical protein